MLILALTQNPLHVYKILLHQQQQPQHQQQQPQHQQQQHRLQLLVEVVAVHQTAFQQETMCALDGQQSTLIMIQMAVDLVQAKKIHMAVLNL
jgi:hypothetical protein